MRAGERGLGTGAIIGIVIGVVIAVVVPVTIAVVLLGGGLGGGGGGGAILASLPVYPGAQNAEENVAQPVITNVLTGMGSPSGWSGKAYTTTASPETVIDWYRTYMTGWTNLEDNTIEAYGITYYVLAYEKGNDAAAIMTFIYPDVGNFLILVAGPKQTSGPGDNTGGGTEVSIIGTWTGEHGGATETFTFRNDGTYDWSSDGDSQSGTWSMSGDNILRLDGSPPDFKVVFATDAMKWYEQDPSTGNWDVLSRSFTKVA